MVGGESRPAKCGRMRVLLLPSAFAPAVGGVEELTGGWPTA